jgi:hypothetical protein
MRFRGDIYHYVNLVDETVHQLGVAYVAFYEGITFVVLYVMQVCRISSDAYFVDVYDFVVGVFCKYMPAKVAADKT